MTQITSNMKALKIHTRKYFGNQNSFHRAEMTIGINKFNSMSP